MRRVSLVPRGVVWARDYTSAEYVIFRIPDFRQVRFSMIPDFRQFRFSVIPDFRQVRISVTVPEIRYAYFPESSRPVPSRPGN